MKVQERFDKLLKAMLKGERRGYFTNPKRYAKTVGLREYF